jgi:hypothetical protein
VSGYDLQVLCRCVLQQAAVQACERAAQARRPDSHPAHTGTGAACDSQAIQAQSVPPLRNVVGVAICHMRHVPVCVQA